MQDPRIPKKVLTHNNVRPPYSWATGSSSRPSSRCSTRAAWPTWYVEEFYLQNNAISDAGMRELAAAIARGGLAKCKVRFVYGNGDLSEFDHINLW